MSASSRNQSGSNRNAVDGRDDRFIAVDDVVDQVARFFQVRPDFRVGDRLFDEEKSPPEEKALPLPVR